MKKLITIILILAMLVPAAALADYTIAGSWYMYYDKSTAPEISESMFDGNDKAICVYCFEDNGTINFLEFDGKDYKYTSKIQIAGKWERQGVLFKCSFIGGGEYYATLDEDTLTIDTGIKNLTLRRLIPFDPYHDMEYK